MSSVYSKDNRVCVQVDSDNPNPEQTNEPLHFMTVTRPLLVSVVITSNKTIQINVNDSCVFTCSNPYQLKVTNLYGQD